MDDTLTLVKPKKRYSMTTQWLNSMRGECVLCRDTCVGINVYEVCEPCCTPQNRCLLCGTDMGRMNPRQHCGYACEALYYNTSFNLSGNDDEEDLYGDTNTLDSKTQSTKSTYE